MLHDVYNKLMPAHDIVEPFKTIFERVENLIELIESTSRLNFAGDFVIIESKY